MLFHPSTVHARTSTPLGSVMLAVSPSGLAGLWFKGQRHFPHQLGDTPSWPENGDHPVLRAAIEQLHGYLQGERMEFDLPLDMSGGTPFQQEVWRALLNIRCGYTLSYAQLGQQLGRPTAARAVGAAVGRNPLSIIVPCHRVVGSDRSLTGYAGGLPRKTALLTLEHALPL